jgi:hypothetical protein
MRLRRPGHATIVAYLALFVALSGTAMAVKKIGPSGLKKNAVTTKKIADGAVNTSKLKDGAVTEPKLANGAVTGAKLTPNSVGTNKLKDDAVESDKIANAAVVEAKIGNDAVTGSKVADGSLTLADYARVVVDLSVPTGAPFNNGTCQQVGVGAPAVQDGDLPLVLQTVPTPDQRIQAVSATSSAGGSLVVQMCNFSGTDVTTPPAVALKVALLR